MSQKANVFTQSCGKVCLVFLITTYALEGLAREFRLTAYTCLLQAAAQANYEFLPHKLKYSPAVVVSVITLYPNIRVAKYTLCDVDAMAGCVPLRQPSC